PSGGFLVPCAPDTFTSISVKYAKKTSRFAFQSSSCNYSAYLGKIDEHVLCDAENILLPSVLLMIWITLEGSMHGRSKIRPTPFLAPLHDVIVGKLCIMLNRRRTRC